MDCEIFSGAAGRSKISINYKNIYLTVMVECLTVFTYKWLVSVKCKNHFNEMEGDVGMSPREKEWKQEGPKPRLDNPSYIKNLLIQKQVFLQMKCNRF